MGWFRRRRGRHVAGRVVFLDPAGRPSPTPTQRRPLPPAPPTPPRDLAAPQPDLAAPLRDLAAPQRDLAAHPQFVPAVPERRVVAVSLGFRDGSEFRMPATDPTAQELIAVANELSRLGE